MVLSALSGDAPGDGVTMCSRENLASSLVASSVTCGELGCAHFTDEQTEP